MLARAPGRHVKLDIEIIGVVADALYVGPRDGVHRQVFVLNDGNGGVTYYVRAQMASASIDNVIEARLKPRCWYCWL